MTNDPPRGDLRPPSINADEKATLVAFLGYLRDAVAAKVDGVAEDAAARPGVPSGTSLLGLVAHLTAVEHNWFVWAYAGADEPLRDDSMLPAPGDAVADLSPADAATGPPPVGVVAGLLAAYRAAIERSDQVIRACDDLDRSGARSLRETPPPSMRWVLVHMIEETARHAGHADILRERVDGSVGR